jgi:hypothetical protein
MYKSLSVAATLALAALAPATASAAWTAPTTLSPGTSADPVAQGAFGGSVLTGFLQPTASLSKALGPLAPITAADPFEKAWAGALDKAGDAVVLTVRRHAPYQRIRATFVAADGTRSATRTISTDPRSSAQPQLSVAPDGTAVAGWVHHEATGWTAQVAVRRPGQAAFDKPQTVSPVAPATGRVQSRPIVNVAAGDGGRAALTWQFGGSEAIPESPLHMMTAGTDGVFRNDQALEGAGGYADVGLAVGAGGAVQVAYLDEHFAGHEASSSLRVAQGTVGAPLSAPAVLSTGGKGTSSGNQVSAAFSDDGTATVAWAKPGQKYEAGGTLEVFSRPAGGAFGAAQTVGEGALGVALAGGPGNAAVLAWMQYVNKRATVQATTRPQAGGPFGAAQELSATDRNALWPSVAMTPAGEAVAAWVTNTTGGGDGSPTAAIDR